MMHDEAMGREAATLRVVRGLLLAILLIGCTGTLAELLLLEHYEDALQLIPLALLSASLVTLLWTVARPGPLPIRLFQLTMACCIAAAGVGLVLHYRANVEFQREIDPSVASMALFWKVMAAKAPPALAPAVLAQLGLIGLAYSYGHPARHASMARGQEGERRDSNQ